MRASVARLAALAVCVALTIYFLPAFLPDLPDPTDDQVIATPSVETTPVGGESADPQYESSDQATVSDRGRARREIAAILHLATRFEELYPPE